MLADISIGIAIIINIIIICLWHFLAHIICSQIGQKHVDYRKKPFRTFKFEKGGKFYIDNFDIIGWYMLIPIKFNRDGITNQEIKEANVIKLKAYMTSTCRSELCSLLNCLYFVFSVIFNVPYLGFILGCLVVLANLPFIMANRYARTVLLKEYAKKRKQHKLMEYIGENSPKKYDLDLF